MEFNNHKSVSISWDTRKKLCYAIAIANGCLASVAMPQVAFAQDEQAQIEEVVVTGTRREGVSTTEALSPVDVLDGSEISDQAAFDLTDALSKITPSLSTQRFPIADGTAFVRPVSLRNLSPDQTLVLVNGTRRHRSPLVNLQLAPVGTINQGSQGVDFSTIPAAAVKRVEVLRDGASAQYGSDAIAGVVNVVLNDAAEGYSISSQYGSYSEGDGDRFTLSGNAGFGFGDGGFLNLTAEYSTSDTTSRGAARPDAIQVANAVGADLVPFNGLGQRWGDPDVEAMKFFANFGVNLSESVELYGNASYYDNETTSGFFYRGPVLDPSEMFAARTTLQIDNDGDFLPDDALQSTVDGIVAGGGDPADFLVADAGSPSGFVLRNPIFDQFPGGYNPTFGAELSDYAVVVGARGEADGGLGWDLRVRFAESEVDYTLSDSINPSLGRLSPTSFRPGTLTQEETSINADFVQEVDVSGLASPLNIGFGAEFRNETYKIGAGDTASIVNGPAAAIFGVGSDGFQGFPTESAGSFESDSFAAYIDLEADITDQFSLGTAARYEDFDEFGSTFDWKLSGRLQIVDSLAVRATVNTGFRAPTPGQVNTLNVTTAADSMGNLIPNGTYPVDNPVAIALGAIPLTPEESTSFTVGFVFEPTSNTAVTLDFYDIEIEDRLALQNNTVDQPTEDLLVLQGVPNAENLAGTNANFFSNAFDSDIQGIDLAVVSDFELGGSILTVDLKHSYNKQEADNVRAGTIDGSRVFDLENQVPNHNTVLTFSYDTDEIFSGLVRLNRYGDWDSTGGLFGPMDGTDGASYGAKVLVDVEARLDLGENYAITLGGENILDEEPDAEQNGVLQFLGVRDSLTSPFGFNGAFWYLRGEINF